MDPSIFAIGLETLAMKAFVDMSQIARLLLVRDRFIARQDSCTLRRHLDSVAPETHIRDIVDRCHVWENHADLEDQQGWYPSPGQPLPVYTIDNGEMVNGPPEVTEDITPEAQELLESLMRHLLPTSVVSPPKATPIPSELELLMQRLMGNDQPVQPAPLERSSCTDMEVLLQNLLPVGPPAMEQPHPAERRNRLTVVCGESGYVASWCPTLDKTFPFMPPGWQAERVGDGFVMRSPRMMAERRRAGNDD